MGRVAGLLPPTPRGCFCCCCFCCCSSCSNCSSSVVVDEQLCLQGKLGLGGEVLGAKSLGVPNCSRGQPAVVASGCGLNSEINTGRGSDMVTGFPAATGSVGGIATCL